MTRWGILGLGRIAHKFAQDLRTLPDAQLYAVASTDAARADDFARQYAVPHAFGHYEGLLSLPDLDVVYVATPHVQHHANALMLLRAGVAVLGEKPFAMNGRQVRELVDAARSGRVFLMEALWSRFMPGIQQVLTWVRQGQIGPVRLLQADFGFRAPFRPEGRLFNPALGGGSLLDIGIYPLFLAQLLLGSPDHVVATAQLGPTGVDEQCGMLLRYNTGALATLSSTLVAQTGTEALIWGETGMIRVHSRFHEPRAVTLERSDEPPETVAFPRTTFGYDYEARHVMDCLRAGHTESPLWSLNDSLALIDLLDAVRAAAGIHYVTDRT